MKKKVVNKVTKFYLKKLKIKKRTFTLCSSVKYNEMIYFVLSVKLIEEIGLLKTPLNALFSMQIVFYSFLRKKA